MFHRAFFNSIIDEYQHMHFFHIQHCISLQQGFSKGVPRHTNVPRNFCTVPREKVLGKCEHIKKDICIKY